MSRRPGARTDAPTTSIAVVLLVGCASASLARPLLDQASPTPASTAASCAFPRCIVLSEPLLPARSDAVVRSATGAVVSTGKARVIDNKELQVPVTPLTPGKYKVEWSATSTESRSNQGSF